MRWTIDMVGRDDFNVPVQQLNDRVASLINAYREMIGNAHQKTVRVYGAPLLPFFCASQGECPYHEASRQALNEWIRSSGKFDAVIDLDAAVRDPEGPLRMLPAYDSGDRRHPNKEGYQAMAEAVDLELFKNQETSFDDGESMPDYFIGGHRRGLGANAPFAPFLKSPRIRLVRLLFQRAFVTEDAVPRMRRSPPDADRSSPASSSLWISVDDRPFTI